MNNEKEMQDSVVQPLQQTIKEGQAVITTAGKVFYNPVQEFNRDLSISVLNTFVKLRQGEVKQTEDGIVILEALSATGLRSIRYAKEVAGLKHIVANDCSKQAFNDITANVSANQVDNLVKASLHDATLLMYEHKEKSRRFDVIDLDPYGCPSIFLDSAVQAISDGGLLLVTATDMAVLAGNSPETCYSKYGAISLRTKSCHEMALRILLQCVQSHANRYGRYIEPLLSISADFYIRVFVRVHTGPNMCKYTTSKLSYVQHCTECDSFTLQPLGVLKTNNKGKPAKFGLPNMNQYQTNCEHCRHSLQLGGPIWSGAIHSTAFVQDLLGGLCQSLSTAKRIEGMLKMVLEELPDVPLYYTLDRLAATLHTQTPPILLLRSALLNKGYQVSSTHCNKVGIKCSGGGRALWAAMRAWVDAHAPLHQRHLADDNCTVVRILRAAPIEEHTFELHRDANPASRKCGALRFQANPQSHWGPGTRATAMVGDGKLSKKKRNQGKRKRDDDTSIEIDEMKDTNAQQ